MHDLNKMRKKWRMFQAMDFESLMYPCFISCRILGIFPYKLNGSTFVLSKSHYILSTVIVCVYCVFNSLLIRDIINSKCDFGSVIKNLQAMNCYMICGFIMIITHVLSGPRMRLLQTVFEISSNLSSESYQQMSRFIHVKDTLGIIFRFVQINVCFSKQEYEINYLFIIIVTFTIYISLVEYQMNMLYINCVCILKACFKRINDNLAHIFMVNDIRPCVSKFICHVQGNQFLLIKLKILMKQHLMISNTVQMLNIIFSLQLLATIVMIFLNITFELYLYVVRWQDGAFFNLDKRFFDVLLTSTAYNILYIALLVWAAARPVRIKPKKSVLLFTIFLIASVMNK